MFYASLDKTCHVMFSYFDKIWHFITYKRDRQLLYIQVLNGKCVLIVKHYIFCIHFVHSILAIEMNLIYQQFQPMKIV